MARAKRHTFQILTKRAVRMRAYCEEKERRAHERGLVWTLPNVWLGVSVEDQERADERVPELLETPAARRFVSYEPALGAVDFRKALGLDQAPIRVIKYERGETDEATQEKIRETLKALGSDASGIFPAGAELEIIPPRRLDWIIVGGESGPGARPFDIAWARKTVADCKEAGVPVFVKQLGARPVISEATCSLERAMREGGYRLHDRKGGDMAEWAEDLRVREFPT